MSNEFKFPTFGEPVTLSKASQQPLFRGRGTPWVTNREPVVQVLNQLPQNDLAVNRVHSSQKSQAKAELKRQQIENAKKLFAADEQWILKDFLDMIDMAHALAGKRLYGHGEQGGIVSDVVTSKLLSAECGFHNKFDEGVIRLHEEFVCGYEKWQPLSGQQFAIVTSTSWATIGAVRHMSFEIICFPRRFAPRQNRFGIRLYSCYNPAVKNNQNDSIWEAEDLRDIINYRAILQEFLAWMQILPSPVQRMVCDYWCFDPEVN